MEMNSVGMATVLAITVICYLAGEIAKASSLANKWIPCLCGVLGGVLGIPAMNLLADFPATDPVTAVAVGIASGLAATGVNQVIKQLGDSADKE